MEDPIWFREFKDKIQALENLKHEIENEKYWLDQGYMGKDIYEKEKAQEEKIERLEAEYSSLYDPYIENYLNLGKGWFTLRPKPDIAKYMGATPFYPSIMINISPDWKGKFGTNKLKDKVMIKGFKQVIESYLNETIGPNKRFTKWKYCLECGSEGNFLHAHIVAELNPKILKSMKSHINHHGHVQQLKKYFKKYFKGMDGLIKGKYSVQRNLINSEIILLDKLKYLLEENKCEGHRNLKDLNLVFGDF